VGREPRALRVGLTTAAPNGAQVHPDCVAAAEDAARLLESLGHHVEAAAPAWDAEGFTELFVAVWIAEHGAGVKGLGGLLGQPLDEELLEPLSQEMLAAARAMSAADALAAITALRSYARRVVTWWDDHDVLVTPALAQPPIPLGSLAPGPDEPALQMLQNSAVFVPFTPPFNATGQPAISLPLAQSGDGLPIGVQLVGPPAGEELLLSLAGQVERAAPWAERRPGVGSPAAT
jgi:amidase